MTNLTVDEILESDEYAEWVQDNAHTYGYMVCNGNTLMNAMEDDAIALAYLKHIDYQGEE